MIMLPIALIFVVGIVFLILERIAPGRSLPHSSGWYGRAVLLNGIQLGVVLIGGVTWTVWLQGSSVFNVSLVGSPLIQGLICWFVGTFFFYWWHRARHRSHFLWKTLHQIHHSPGRIETITAFYKHPVEIGINSVLSTAIIFPLLGASVEAATWYSFFAAVGEFYYHVNLRTPRWTGYFLQRPEHHSIHHQLNVHYFNFGDITWWDRIFGSFRDADAFVPQCGFANERERLLVRMLAFQDVNQSRNDSSG